MIRRGYILSLGAALLFFTAAIGAGTTVMLLDPPGPNEYLFPDRPVVLEVDTIAHYYPKWWGTEKCMPWMWSQK